MPEMHPAYVAFNPSADVQEQTSALDDFQPGQIAEEGWQVLAIHRELTGRKLPGDDVKAILLAVTEVLADGR